VRRREFLQTAVTGPLVLALLGGCDNKVARLAFSGEAVPTRHAKRFSIERGEGFVVLRVSSRDGPADQQRHIVLFAPDATGEVIERAQRGSVVVRAPVQRIAANNATDEAFLIEVGALDRLVAVGGTKTYFDALRQRTRAGDVVQLGYDWHTPPNLDLLATARPDVFLMRLSDLRHAASLERSLSLGVPTIPTFVEDEETYLARAEWLVFFGSLVGRTQAADERFRDIERRVADLKLAIAHRPRKKAVWAYPQGADRWVAIVGGADAEYLNDAGADNLLAAPADAKGRDTLEVSTERLLSDARDADCWIIGDVHAARVHNKSLLSGIRAWRDERLFTNTLRFNAEADAFDWYQSAVVRPDEVLADFVQMIHPELGRRPFKYLGPIAGAAVP